MRQKPIVQFRILIGRGPRIVSRIGIGGELGVSTGAIDRTDHFFGAFYRHYRVFGAVKRPNGYILQLTGDVGLPAAADRRDRGKPFGIATAQRPRSEATHTQSGQVHAVRVHVVFFDDLIQQGIERIHLGRPPVIRRTLGRDDNEWEFFPLFG